LHDTSLAAPAEQQWVLPARGPVAMYGLIFAESTIFAIFVAAYIYYVGKSLTGPYPKEVLELPIFASICLLSSSGTIHFAIPALRKGNIAAFGMWWFATLALGTIFLVATGMEWHHLIYEKGLTISTNLFGTTYYSLVGLHAFHVTVGLIGLALGMIFTLLGAVRQEHAERADVFALYWHFVDVVWVAVFTVVYIIGR
jgi:cytochrome c oxidase subunit 3